MATIDALPNVGKLESALRMVALEQVMRSVPAATRTNFTPGNIKLDEGAHRLAVSGLRHRGSHDEVAISQHLPAIPALLRDRALTARCGRSFGKAIADEIIRIQAAHENAEKFRRYGAEFIKIKAPTLTKAKIEGTFEKDTTKPKASSKVCKKCGPESPKFPPWTEDCPHANNA